VPFCITCPYSAKQKDQKAGTRNAPVSIPRCRSSQTDKYTKRHATLGALIPSNPLPLFPFFRVLRPSPCTPLFFHRCGCLHEMNMDFLLITTPWPAQSLSHSFPRLRLFIPAAIFSQKSEPAQLHRFDVFWYQISPCLLPIRATTMESHLLGMFTSALWI